MERAIADGVRPTLVGLEPGALLAGATIMFWLQERGADFALATCGEDPLAAPLARALAARSLPAAITVLDMLDGIEAPILIGAGGAIDAALGLLEGSPRSGARIALVGLGAEVCVGIEAERTAARLAACLAEGSLIDRTLLQPRGTIARAWIELVEDVHHEIGPARQLPIVDAIRAALFGKHGRVAVDLAARDCPALVTLDTASILWLDPARMTLGSSAR
ncbi:MAG: hypothetical protein M3Y87_37040 [Myxococcota bacterium]|nr:hypothetical protein [Myxococcota bacterium]